jgi:hypothetical protein
MSNLNYAVFDSLSINNDDIIRNVSTKYTNQLDDEADKHAEMVVNNILDNELSLTMDSTYSKDAEMMEAMNEELLEEFKKDLDKWLELDSQLKKLASATKDRKEKKNILNEKIISFMSKYKLEDIALNKNKCMIRYTNTYKKKTLSQKVIKERLNELFDGETETLDKINKIFEDRETVERNSIRKLKL